MNPSAEKPFREKFVSPSEENVKEISKKFGFDFTPEEHKYLTKHIGLNMQAYDALNQLPDYLPEVKYPRKPGYFPSSDENKLNAWYVKTDIKGAPEGKLAGRKIVLKDNVSLASMQASHWRRSLEPLGYVCTQCSPSKFLISPKKALTWMPWKELYQQVAQ